jgi:hypothetical protein
MVGSAVHCDAMHFLGQVLDDVAYFEIVLTNSVGRQRPGREAVDAVAGHESWPRVLLISHFAQFSARCLLASIHSLLTSWVLKLGASRVALRASDDMGN